MEKSMEIEFYLRDTNEDEIRLNKVIDCSIIDSCTINGIFNEFKNFLKSIGYNSDSIDSQLQNLNWQTIGCGEDEKFLENGEIVLISRNGKCEPYEYEGNWPAGTTHWCYLPHGFKCAE